MHLVPTALLSCAFGFLVVLSTSPNTPTSFHSLGEGDALSIAVRYHASFADFAFALLITFLVLCHTHHKWVATSQSFPYTYHVKRTFARQNFNFQVFIFEVFHVEKLSRRIHMLNLVLEQILWLAIVRGTFGTVGLAILVSTLAAQVVSHQDIVLSTAVMATDAVFALVVSYLYAVGIRYDVSSSASVAIAKTGILYAVTVRTLSHIMEPLPPSYDDEMGAFTPSFGPKGWRLCLEEPGRASRLFLLGVVSEIGAGMPGRLFNVVVYKFIWCCGHRSHVLVDVQEAKRQAIRVQRRGWRIRSITRGMYAWATVTPPAPGRQKE